MIIQVKTRPEMGAINHDKTILGGRKSVFQSKSNYMISVTVYGEADQAMLKLLTITTQGQRAEWKIFFHVYNAELSDIFGACADILNTGVLKHILFR